MLAEISTYRQIPTKETAVKNTHTIYAEPLPFRVKNFLVANGLFLASDNGKRMKEPQAKQADFGILKESPVRIKFVPGQPRLGRKLFVGKLHFEKIGDVLAIQLTLFDHNQLGDNFAAKLEETFHATVKMSLENKRPKRKRIIDMLH